MKDIKIYFIALVSSHHEVNSDHEFTMTGWSTITLATSYIERAMKLLISYHECTLCAQSEINLIGKDYKLF